LRRRHRLMFWRRVSGTELEETALELVRYSYEAAGQQPPDDAGFEHPGHGEREGDEAVPRDTS
jgi:hypothetical protein